MYNSRQKEEYLQFIGNDRKVEWTFNNIADFEEGLDKDICKMNSDEITEILVKMKKNTIAPEKSRIEKYIEWCRAKRYCNVNWASKKLLPVRRILDRLEVAESRVYIPKEEYENFCDILKSNINGSYYLPIMMACYENMVGKNYENLIHLRIKDIDESRNFIHLHNGSVVSVSHQLIVALLKAAKVDELIFDTKVSKLKGGIYSDSVFKSQKEDPSETTIYRRFIDIMNRIREILDNSSITINNLSNSHLFDYVVTKAQKDGLDVKMHMTQDGKKLDNLTLLYQRYFNEIGENMPFPVFKYRFERFIKYIK